MSSSELQARGLTRVILEALLESTPEALASGETIDESLLAQVEQRVHDDLAPRSMNRDRLIFDFVFKRAFAEAKELYLALHKVLPLERPQPAAREGIRAFA